MLNKNPKNGGVTSTYNSVLTLNSHTNTVSCGNIPTMTSNRSRKKISVLDFKEKNDKNKLKEVKEINNEDKSEITDLNN